MTQEDFEKRFRRAKRWIRIGGIIVALIMATLVILKYNDVI